MSTLLNLDNHIYRHEIEIYDHNVFVNSPSPTYSVLSMESSPSSSSSRSNLSPQSANSDYNFQALNITPTYEISYITDNSQTGHVFSYSPNGQNDQIFNHNAHLVILEQPVDKFRFRYQSEMHGTHGSLMGKKTEKSKKTYPSVELRGFQGEAKIRCSLYQVDPTRRNPHSHHLVIKNGEIDLIDPHDICISPDKGYTAVFQGMGIIHTAKKFIAEELFKKMKKEKETELNRDLTLREEHQLQKESTEQSKSMNLNQVCLKFQAFEVDPNTGHWQSICEPVYTNPINNMKSALTGELKICRLSTAVSNAEGGEEVFIFVEKVCKNNIKIRFFELDEYDNEIWFDWGAFSEVDVHHQYAIAFKTPPYKNKEINESVEVFIQLYRPRDGCRSEAVPFKYKPKNMNSTSRKRQRINSCSSSEIPTVVSEAPPYSQASVSDDYTISKEFNKSGIIQEILDSQMASTVSNDITFNSADFKYFVQCDSEELSKIMSEIEHCQELSKLETDSVGQQISENGLDKLFNDFREQSVSEADTNMLNKLLSIIKIFRGDYLKCGKMLSALWMSSNKKGINCLQTAIEKNFEEISMKLIDLLLELKLNDLLDAASLRNETLLHVAIANNRMKIVQKLLESGVNSNCCDFGGNTALHRAIKEGSFESIENILNICGAKIKMDASNDEGFTALHLAVKYKNLKSVKLLINREASHRIKDMKHGNNILHMAIENNSLDIIVYILEEIDNSLIHEPNNSGHTPIELALANNSSKLIVRELTKYSATKTLHNLNQNDDEEEEDESDEEDLEGENDESVLSSMNLTDTADVIKILEGHAASDKRRSIEIGENSTENHVFDEICLGELSKIFNEDGLWLKLASLLELEYFVHIWESSNNPSASLLHYVEMQQMDLQNLLGLFEALDLRDAIKSVDEMICRKIKMDN